MPKPHIAAALDIGTGAIKILAVKKNPKPIFFECDNLKFICLWLNNNKPAPILIGAGKNSLLQVFFQRRQINQQSRH